MNYKVLVAYGSTLSQPNNNNQQKRVLMATLDLLIMEAPNSPTVLDEKGLISSL